MLPVACRIEEADQKSRQQNSSDICIHEYRHWAKAFFGLKEKRLLVFP
jgi:hypothetical protein